MKLLFSTYSLAKLLSNSLLLDSLLSDSSMNRSHLKNQPITFKVVVTCVRALARLLSCFWRLIASRRHGGLRMFSSALQVFLRKFRLSFLTWLFFFSRKLQFFLLFGNKTSCRPIWCVIILVINSLL